MRDFDWFIERVLWTVVVLCLAYFGAHWLSYLGGM